MSTLNRYLVLLVLALWGLASVHCKLEIIPGMEFLQTCCATDSSSTASEGCEHEGCCAIEEGNYRSEEKTVFAPQPVFSLVLLAAVIEVPSAKLEAGHFTISKSPPELPRSWQFSWRAAWPPRAPSLVS